MVMDQPKQFRYIVEKPKRHQQMEGRQSSHSAHVVVVVERYTEIERENKILLDKMTSILQKQGPCSQHGTSVSIPPPTATLSDGGVNSV